MAQTHSEAMTATLNLLMNGEFRAAHLYFQASAWCETKKLTGCASFMLTHASEEMMHMQKVFTYITDIDLPAKFEALPEPKLDAESLPLLLEEIYRHEKIVTQRFVAAAKKASDVGDLSTFEFLQWFIVEQREEEMLFRGILDRVALIGEGPHSLYYIDTEVSKIGGATSTSGASQPM